MELKLNIDLDTIITNAVNSALSPEAVQETIGGLAKSAVEKALESSLGYNSDFRNAIAEQIKAAMPVGDYAIPRYHDYILKAVQEAVADTQQELAQRMIPEQVKKLVAFDPPKEIEITALLTILVEGFRDYNDERNHTFIAETSDSYNRRSIDIYADDQPHRDKYSCDFQIRLKEMERDSGLYEIWCLRDSDSTKDKRRFISCRFNSDALMLNLYTARTKIKVGDFDEFDIDELAQEAMSEWNSEHNEENW